MAHRVASRGGGSNGLAPLCVKDKRKAKAAAATAAAAAAVPATANARGNGNINNVNNNNNDRSVAMNNPAASHVGNSPPPCCAGSEEALSPPPPCRLAPVVIERSEIIRLASQYTPCAGCSAAVKGLLQRPIQELRLVNAVVEEGVRAGEEEAGGDGRGRSKGGGGGGDRRHGGNGGGGGAAHGERACGHGCGRRASERVHHSCGQSSSSSTAGLPRPLCLREAYLTDRARFDQLLEIFPLEPLMKKVQPRGVGLRCEMHRRNVAQSTADGWEWEEVWDRLPVNMRLKVAAIDVDVLEAAMHQATSTHRFCADCKHNVVMAFDILTCKCDLADIDNEDEFLPDLFWPFAGRIGPVEGDQTGLKALLSCPLEDVEELICWHENFDSREYTRSSQRHAATLEHGQREIRSIVGSVLLTQLRTNYHIYLAQVQGEQYLFALVLHAIQTRIQGSDRGLHSAGGKSWPAGPGGGPAACSACGGAADSGCLMCGGTGVSLSELGFVDDDDKKGKTKSKKKRERKARAKAAKKTQDEGVEGGGGSGEGPETAAGAQGRRQGEATTVPADGKCNRHSAYSSARAKANASANGNGSADRQGLGGGHSSRQAKVSGHHPTSKSTDPAAGRTGEWGTTNTKANVQGEGAASARQRAGSSGIESAGSLLSMLDESNGRGGNGGHAEDDDEGIDEELMREMERLRNQKAHTGVQRTRAALRSNLQKNFNQLLLVSSTTAKETGGKL